MVSNLQRTISQYEANTSYEKIYNYNNNKNPRNLNRTKSMSAGHNYYKDASANNNLEVNESATDDNSENNTVDEFLEEIDKFDVEIDKDALWKSWKINPPNSLVLSENGANRYKKNSVNQSRTNRRVLSNRQGRSQCFFKRGCKIFFPYYL